MSNLLIKNTQSSILDMAPLRDVFDVALVLAPKGTPGDFREITEDVATTDTVQRVKAAGWVLLNPMSPLPQAAAPVVPTVSEPITVPEPAAESVAATAVAPVVEPATAPVVEPVAEPADVPVVEPVAAPVSEPAVEPVVEPVAAPVAEPVVEPVAEPVVEPAPVVEPVVESAPAAEPATATTAARSSRRR